MQHGRSGLGLGMIHDDARTEDASRWALHDCLQGLGRRELRRQDASVVCGSQGACSRDSNALARRQRREGEGVPAHGIGVRVEAESRRLQGMWNCWSLLQGMRRPLGDAL